MLLMPQMPQMLLHTKPSSAQSQESNNGSSPTDQGQLPLCEESLQPQTDTNPLAPSKLEQPPPAEPGNSETD